MQSTALPAARRVAVVAGAAAAAAAAAGAQDPAEARAARPAVEEIVTRPESMQVGASAVVRADDLEQAQKGLLVAMQTMGNGWVDVQAMQSSDSLEDLLNMGTELAQDPMVQRKFLEIAERKGSPTLALQMMADRSSFGASDSGPVPTHGPQQSVTQSLTFSNAALVESESVQSLPESLSPTTSVLDEVETQADKDSNPYRRESRVLAAAATTVQAVGRGKLSRGGFYRRWHEPAPDVLLSHLPTEPRVALNLAPVERRVDGTVGVVVDLCVHTVRIAPPLAAVAIVVGLLAVCVSRNPALARVATYAAAGVVLAIYQRTRSQMAR